MHSWFSFSMTIEVTKSLDLVTHTIIVAHWQIKKDKNSSLFPSKNTFVKMIDEKEWNNNNYYNYC